MRSFCFSKEQRYMDWDRGLILLTTLVGTAARKRFETTISVLISKAPNSHYRRERIPKTLGLLKKFLVRNSRPARSGVLRNVKKQPSQHLLQLRNRNLQPAFPLATKCKAICLAGWSLKLNLLTKLKKRFKVCNSTPVMVLTLEPANWSLKWS